MTFLASKTALDAPQSADPNILGMALFRLDSMAQIKIVAGRSAAASLHLQIQLRLCQLFGHAQVETCPIDEVFVIRFEAGDADQAFRQAEAALTDIAAQYIDHAQGSCATTAHVGLAWREAGESLEALHRRAQLACGTARDQHKQIWCYDATCRRYEAAMTLLCDLPQAMTEGRLMLLGQEILTLGAPQGHQRLFEVLLQVQGRDGQLHGPTSFITQAENSQLIELIDRWVIRTTLVTHAALLRQAPEIALSINLSGRSIGNAALWPFIAALLAETGVQGSQLQFEITETAEIVDMTCAAHCVKAAQAAGCRVVLDDFGAGRSSYRYLEELGVNGLKIDGSLVQNVTTPDAIESEIIRSLVLLTEELGLDIVAEHVSSPAILFALRRLGVKKLQGYAVAMPQPLVDVLRAAINR